MSVTIVSIPVTPACWAVKLTQTDTAGMPLDDCLHMCALSSPDQCHSAVGRAGYSDSLHQAHAIPIECGA
jgi:hypothetical protein